MQKPEPAAAAADEEEEGEEDGEEEKAGGRRRGEEGGEGKQRASHQPRYISTVRIKGLWITLLPLGIIIRAL